MLTSSDHAQIKSYLADLSSQEVINVGVELGLKYIKLNGNANDMVMAWLRKDDNVMGRSGEPSWDSLCEALEAYGHNGIALRIKEKGNLLMKASG